MSFQLRVTEWRYIRVCELPHKCSYFPVHLSMDFQQTGILPVCANEDGLAAVLGHEASP